MQRSHCVQAVQDSNPNSAPGSIRDRAGREPPRWIVPSRKGASAPWKSTRNPAPALDGTAWSGPLRDPAHAARTPGAEDRVARLRLVPDAGRAPGSSRPPTPSRRAGVEASPVLLDCPPTRGYVGWGDT